MEATQHHHAHLALSDSACLSAASSSSDFAWSHGQSGCSSMRWGMGHAGRTSLQRHIRLEL